MSRVKYHRGQWTRAEVAADINNCYIFGDNTEDREVTHHVPRTTQAVIRGLRNTVGIDTKNNRLTFESSYLTDEDYDRFVRHVQEQLQKAKDYIAKTGGCIVLPVKGIGTGKAQLPTRAPQCFQYLQRALWDLEKETSSIF